MAPVIVLFATTGTARLLGLLFGRPASWPQAVAIGLAAMFLLTAGAHFTQPRRGQLIDMVPPQLPKPAALVTFTGVLEFAGAVGLLVPATSRVAAVCLTLLLLTMFPANVHAARADLGIKTMPLPLRTAVQVLFVGACAVVTMG